MIIKNQVGNEWQRELETLAFRLKARLDSINHSNRFPDDNCDFVMLIIAVIVIDVIAILIVIMTIQPTGARVGGA